MQSEKYHSDELLLVQVGKFSKFAIFLKENALRDKNIFVELVDSGDKIWIRESQII